MNINRRHRGSQLLGTEPAYSFPLPHLQPWSCCPDCGIGSCSAIVVCASSICEFGIRPTTASISPIGIGEGLTIFAVVRLAIHPCNRLQGILAKSNKPLKFSLNVLSYWEKVGASTTSCTVMPLFSTVPVPNLTWK